MQTIQFYRTISAAEVNKHYLQRVTVLLGELAAIDPGGNWANRPSNSLTDIFLPWFPQTCAPVPKRKAAVTALIKEQPAIGWKLIVSLLPSGHSSSMGCRINELQQQFVNWQKAMSEMQNRKQNAIRWEIDFAYLYVEAA
jgi:hypothetical protein